jgi:photosystem II stability/assembly factor-like uncharacterized protein
MLMKSLFLLLAWATLALGPAARAAQPPLPLTWRDTGITATGSFMCLDDSQPDIVFVAAPDGTAAYNWRSGERTLLSQHPFDRCGPNGLLFDIPDQDGAPFDGPTWRFRAADRSTTTIAHAPTHLSPNGSPQLYALHDDGRLWASPDGGTTWQRRGQKLAGKLTSLAVSAADARAIYVLAIQGTRQAAPEQIITTYTIFFSADAGRTWAPRSTRQLDGPVPEGERYLGIATLPGNTTPSDTLQLVIREGITPSTPSQYLVSVDGARTFRAVGSGSGYNQLTLVHSGDAILRLTGGQYGARTRLARSRDGGQTWEDLPAPPRADDLPGGSCFYPYPQVVGHAPANLLLCDDGDAWYSPDGGGSWQSLGTGVERLFTTPYEPLTLLDWRADGRLYALDLPSAGNRLSAPVSASHSAGSVFFPQTGHNLSGCFQRYWQAHGGLAQFGYPLTEPLRELNPADGRVYLAQYFERARFEEHPEPAGACPEVLLGLLGNQLTAARREAGEAPFRRMDDPNLPEVIYFAQTGHTLRGVFARYWQQNGGLAIYGYPISEVFTEVNPDDNRPYQVQYFERARFEEHPELAATRSEVLLGLLGDELLRARGWR